MYFGTPNKTKYVAASSWRLYQLYVQYPKDAITLVLTLYLSMKYINMQKQSCVILILMPHNF